MPPTTGAHLLTGDREDVVVGTIAPDSVADAVLDAFDAVAFSLIDEAPGVVAVLDILTEGKNLDRVVVGTWDEDAVLEIETDAIAVPTP